MGLYDIVMLLVFGGSILFGYWKGLTWQIASLAAIIISYIVAANFNSQISGLIRVDEPWNKIGAMLVLFLGTSLVIWTIYAYLNKSIQKNELKGFDRQAGAVLGALKGGLLCMVITMFSVSILGESIHNSIDNSTLGRYVEKGIWQVSNFVPAELAKFVDPHIASYKEASGHGEPEVDPQEDINDLVQQGAGYIKEQLQLNQNASQVPAGLSATNQTGYSGTWETSTPQPSSQDRQFGTNVGLSGGNTQTAQNQTGGIDLTALKRQIVEEARSRGIELTWEMLRDEAQRRLNELNASQQR